jgi:hypothetical protein
VKNLCSSGSSRPNPEHQGLIRHASSTRGSLEYQVSSTHAMFLALSWTANAEQPSQPDTLRPLILLRAHPRTAILKGLASSCCQDSFVPPLTRHQLGLKELSGGPLSPLLGRQEDAGSSKLHIFDHHIGQCPLRGPRTFKINRATLAKGFVRDFSRQRSPQRMSASFDTDYRTLPREIAATMSTMDISHGRPLYGKPKERLTDGSG